MVARASGVGGKWGMTVKGSGLSLWDDKIVLKLIIVMVSQPYKCIKTIEWYTSMSKLCVL